MTFSRISPQNTNPFKDKGFLFLFELKLCTTDKGKFTTKTVFYDSFANVSKPKILFGTLLAGIFYKPGVAGAVLQTPL